ncbi:MAG: NAD(P)/FAD-dependent oxidoreductase, partial [Steroidobacteraceae bacterium]
VVVIGGGFAGLWAVRALARAPVQITLIDRTNHHLFQPLLYEVATAGLSAPDIAAPLRHILRRQRNVTVLCAPVWDIRLAGREVCVAGQILPYDYLLVAAGASHSYFGHPEWAQFAPGLKTLQDALGVRQRILAAFESAEREDDPVRRAAWLRFAVIGGGPTGVELAGTLAEIARHTLPGEFRRADPASAEVHLIEAGPRLLAAMPAALSEKARLQLQHLGVTVQLQAPVSQIDAQGVLMGGRRIECRTVLWAAGVAASPLGRMLSEACDRQGRVAVAPDLSLPGHAEVFVAGDLASLKIGVAQVPGVATAAKQMGSHVAAMIRADLQGGPRSAFVYRDYGNLATIGRRAAVVAFGRLHLSGLIAWLFWLTVHLFFLIGFRNRLIVLLNWGWSYFTHQRHARVIIDPDRLHP